jgi:hypothetical protein
MRILCLTLLLLPNFCIAEIIDRIAITVANQVVTEGQIEDDIRVTAFLNHEKVDLTAGERKKAADRLIEQSLVKRDMELSHYPLPPETVVDEPLRKIEQGYTTPAAYRNALLASGITEEGLKHRLLWQETLERFIEFRFRNAIQISDTDIQAYYQEQLPKWQQQKDKPVPALEDARETIEQVLTEKRIDEALDKWLAETRKQVAVKYLNEALQ